MRRARIAVALFVLPALVLSQACSKTPGMPRAWGPLRLAADSACPRVYGSYDASDRDFAHVVATQYLPFDSLRGRLDAMSLAMDEDSSLTVIGWVNHEPIDTVRLRKGRDFTCADGWLVPSYPQWLPSYADDSLAARARGAGRTSMMLATGDAGALIGRLDHHTYDEFTVWCGDGCKGIPLPWTWRTSHRWYRAAVVNPALHIATDVAEPARPMSAADRRLAEEEARLERGEPPTRR